MATAILHSFPVGQSLLLGLDLVVWWEWLPQVLANSQPVCLLFLLFPDIFLQHKPLSKIQLKKAVWGKAEGRLFPDGCQSLLPVLQDLGADVLRSALADAESNLGSQDLEAAEMKGATLHG